MTIENRADVIVVGAGPAGCACAVEIARAGKKVVVLERGSYAGSKNMFGGAIFSNVVEKIFPNFEKSAPLERTVIKHNYSLLSDDSCVDISYENYSISNCENKAIVVNRAKFDRWCADEAKKDGAYFAYNIVVRELLTDDRNRIIGIRTDNEVFYAPIVVLADGANSLLAKQIGLRKKYKINEQILSVKEVFEFENENILNQRLNLSSNEGMVYEFVGGPLKDKFALGILYTNKKSISIGLGVSMKDLVKYQKKPYELLDELKNVPKVEKLLQGAKPVEYSAHLIPESSPKTMPKLYADGVMVVGDAAMLVNNLHFEGTNLAMMSGMFAAQVAIEALNKNDFSVRVLKKYDKLVKKSFIFKDIKTYKNVMKTLQKSPDTFMGYYIDKINEFFKMFLEVDSKPKKQKYRSFICNFIKNICPCRLLADIFRMIKLMIEAIF